MMSGGGTGEHLFNVSCRAAQAKKEFEREQQANPDVNEIAHYYLAQHKRREAERREREADEQRQQRERRAADEAENKRRLQNRLLAIMYQSEGASDAEIARVDGLMKANRPGSYGNVDCHRVMLMEFRSLIGGNDDKTKTENWAL
jgi:hypothetical protein